MKKNGFTLVELLATLVVLGIVVGITVVSVSGSLSETKKNTEKIFIGTLNKAIGIYLADDEKNLSYESSSFCTSKNIYRANETITFKTIINSTYHPISLSDFKNPNNGTSCNPDAIIKIYRDSNYVYYYAYNGNELGCLETETGIHSNLPEGCLE